MFLDFLPSDALHSAPYTVKLMLCGVRPSVCTHVFPFVTSGPYLMGRGGYGFKPLRSYDEKKLMCLSVGVFQISVQWSFNLDHFMQTFDSELIKNSVKMAVVRSLILCSTFTKIVCRPGSARTRWGTYNTPQTRSWIMGEGRGKERWKGRKGGKRKGGKGRAEGGERKEGGGKGGLSPSEWKSWQRPCVTFLFLLK